MTNSNSLNQNKLNSSSKATDMIVCEVCKEGVYIPLNPKSDVNHLFTCDKCGNIVHFEANVTVE